jgi:hypothetical protein
MTGSWSDGRVPAAGGHATEPLGSFLCDVPWVPRQVTSWVTTRFSPGENPIKHAAINHRWPCRGALDARRNNTVRSCMTLTHLTHAPTLPTPRPSGAMQRSTSSSTQGRTEGAPATPSPESEPRAPETPPGALMRTPTTPFPPCCVSLHRRSITPTSTWARSTFTSCWCWLLGGILIFITAPNENGIIFSAGKR